MNENEEFEFAQALEQENKAKNSVSSSGLPALASNLVTKGIELPLKNPIASRLESGGEIVNKSIQNIAGKVAESGNPLAATGLSMVGDIGKLTPTNMALNVGGEAFGRMAMPGVGKLASEVTGVTTGAGGGAVREAFEAGAEGGAKEKALIGTLRGTVSEKQVTEDALNSLNQIRRARSKEYVSKMEELQGKNFQKKIDLSGIKTKLDDLLNDYNIGRSKKGKLDFSRAALDDPSINDVKRMADTVDSWGTKPGDDTVKGLDILKRKIDDFYSPSGEARSFVSSLRKTVKDSITEKLPEYEKITKRYADVTDTIHDIGKELSLGPNSNAGTIMRKLKQSLRQNFDLRKEFVDTLSKSGKSNLLSQTAGVELSPLAPKGLMRVAAGADILESLHNPMALLGLPLTSPRLVGESALAAGQASRYAKYLPFSLGARTGQYLEENQ